MATQYTPEAFSVLSALQSGHDSLGKKMQATFLSEHMRFGVLYVPAVSKTHEEHCTRTFPLSQEVWDIIQPLTITMLLSWKISQSR